MMKFRFLAAFLLYFSCCPSHAETLRVPAALDEIPVPGNAAVADDLSAAPSQDARVVSQLVKKFKIKNTVDEIAIFYYEAFKPLLAMGAEGINYEDLGPGETSGISYTPDYYGGDDFKNSYSGKTLVYNGKNVRKCLERTTLNPDKAMKFATFVWAEGTEDGRRVLSVEISDDTFDSKGEGCSAGSVITLFDIKFKSEEEREKEAAEEVDKISADKLKEFENYSDAAVFISVPRYPGSEFLIERSASMTAENSGRDTFVFVTADDAEKVGNFYEKIPGMIPVDTEDEMRVFVKTVPGGRTSTVAVAGIASEDGKTITEITFLDGE